MPAHVRNVEVAAFSLPRPASITGGLARTQSPPHSQAVDLICVHRFAPKPRSCSNKAASKSVVPF
ncbi:hypothetical protein R1CP_38855 (plasmid) [Rhodococcus opacus]|uniref:Uncharacterized protein n=1 Tax=Rhodococcus opacus TaxID=37919 RepID=A0A1B1KI29_RHOOP|nr:hypothetical protein R1CP_38350 [Rhodococcus opacus]ANS32359.1 hypothetical protein R1CP_38855 [Rhodococcus opacus]